MKFATLTLATIAFASRNSRGDASPIRRVLKADEGLNTSPSVIVDLTQQSEIDQVSSDSHVTVHRFMQGTACTTDDNRCTVTESCVCEGELDIRENLIPSIGCYHCSKPDGAMCTHSGECLFFESECVDGVCGPEQCPNSATMTVNPDTSNQVVTSRCTTQACDCSGEYSIKEDLRDGGGCYHCAKPDGTQCSDDHECSSSSQCTDGTCGPKQCLSGAEVDSENGTTTSYCGRTECECSGDYSVKEDLDGTGCFHCSKPDGAECSANDECMHRTSRCIDGICAMPVNNCPLYSDGRCTRDDSCVCQMPGYPNRYTHTFQDSSVCYACQA